MRQLQDRCGACPRFALEATSARYPRFDREATKIIVVPSVFALIVRQRRSMWCLLRRFYREAGKNFNLPPALTVRKT